MPEKFDEMEITILEDGTIRTVTSKISAANHAGADQFLKDMERLAGGTTSVQKRHTHGQTHNHAKETEKHSQ